MSKTGRMSHAATSEITKVMPRRENIGEKRDERHACKIEATQNHACMHAAVCLPVHVTDTTERERGRRAKCKEKLLLQPWWQRHVVTRHCQVRWGDREEVQYMLCGREESEHTAQSECAM